MSLGGKGRLVQRSWSWEAWAYLAVVGAVLAGALVREINLLFMVAGLMAGPFLWSWWWAGRALRGISIRRRVPRSICAGDLLVVELTIDNSRSRSHTWALVIEDSIWSLDGQPSDAPVKLYIPFLPRGTSQRLSYRGRIPQRGKYRLGPIRISSRFPFGLFRHWVVVDQWDELIVYPRLGRLSRRWHARWHESFEGAQRREQRSGRAEGDFYGVRPWRPGDSRRWIHWRASARHQTVVVREFELYRNRDLAIIVNLYLPSPQQGLLNESVEWAVSFAATLVNQACRKGGNRIGLGIAGGRPVWLFAPASTGLLEEAMHQLALAQPAPENPLDQLLEVMPPTLPQGTEIICITTGQSSQADLSVSAHLRSQLAGRFPASAVRVFPIPTPELSEYFMVH